MAHTCRSVFSHLQRHLAGVWTLSWQLSKEGKILTNNKPNINKYKRPITNEDCILTSGVPPRLRNRNPPSVLINMDCKNQTGNQTQVRRVSIACCDLLLP